MKPGKTYTRTLRMENGIFPYTIEQEVLAGGYAVLIRERRTAHNSDEFGPWTDWTTLGRGVLDWIVSLR